MAPMPIVEDAQLINVPKLSFCIPTFNRGDLLGQTLDRIIDQATADCEIVVLDGGSTDSTDEIIRTRARLFARLKYIKQNTASGVDRAIDDVITFAQGEFCWLSSSKDFLKPGAVAAILKLLNDDVSLVAVNMEIRDASLSNLLVSRSVVLESDVVYLPGQTDQLFRDAFNLVTHMSCLVIKRTIWLARERQRYYGSLYMHLAVLFQEPLPRKTIVVSDPLVCHRFGSQSWLSGATQMQIMWSPLIESLAVSESTKKLYGRSSVFKHCKVLLLHRALGIYSWTEFRRHLPSERRFGETLLVAVAALIPGSLLNAVFVIQNRLSTAHYKNINLQMLRESPYHVRNWRIVRNSAKSAVIGA